MQKVSEDDLEQAKKYFEKYLEEKNVIENLRARLDNLLQKDCSDSVRKDIDYIKSNLQNIIDADLEQMKKYNNKLKNITDILRKKTKAEKRNKDEQAVYKLSEIFNDFYEAFSKTKKYPYKIIKFLHLKCCPYCNISYTYTVIDNDNNEFLIRPNLDHYFSKSLYPYLSLTFNNLIPVCSFCNSSLKGSKEFLPVHPYFESLDNFMKFGISISNIHNLYKDEDAFDIEIDAKPEVEEHIENFKLQERYQYHKDIVNELLIKKKCYCPEYVENLIKFFNENGIQVNSSYVDLLITGNYTSSENINKRPLAKLNKDIWELISK